MYKSNETFILPRMASSKEPRGDDTLLTIWRLQSGSSSESSKASNLLVRGKTSHVSSDRKMKPRCVKEKT